MARVDDFQAGREQASAEPFPLVALVDAEPRQVPVRVRWVRLGHLVENREGVPVLLGRDGVGEHARDGVPVGFCPWGDQSATAVSLEVEPPAAG